MNEDAMNEKDVELWSKIHDALEPMPALANEWSNNYWGRDPRTLDIPKAALNAIRKLVLEEAAAEKSATTVISSGMRGGYMK